MAVLGKGKIQQALNLAGSQHKYQKIMIFLIACTWIEINYLILGPSLIYIDPLFTCQSTGDRQIKQDQACPMINQCKLIHHFSITAEMSLYCDLEWARDAIQSIFSLGAFLGLVIVNLISDSKGRKVGVLISLITIVIAVLSSGLGGYFHVIALVMIGQFLCGFGSYSIITLCYTLLTDFCSDEFRSKGIIATNSVWGISTVMLGVYYLVELHWMYFLAFAILIPLLLISVCLYLFIVESPYILFNQGRIKESVLTLLQIAQINGNSQHNLSIHDLVHSQQVRTEENQASLANVWKTVKRWQYLKPILLLILIYGIGNLNFFSISYAFSAQGYGYGYNSIIAGCTEMISFIYLSIFIGFAITKLKRRNGIAIFYGITACVGMTFLLPLVNDNKILSTVVLGLGRISGSNQFQFIRLAVAYTMIMCLQAQTFTVQIQSTALGMVEALSLYGVFLAPLLVDLSNKIGINPTALMSIILVFAIWPNKFLKQTFVDSKKQNPLLKDYKSSECQNKNGETNQSQKQIMVDSFASLITNQDALDKKR